MRNFLTFFLGQKNASASVVVVILAALLAAPFTASAVEFTDAEKAKLKAGKIVRKELPTSRKKGFYGGTGWAIVKASPEVIWKTLMDFDNYPKIFQNTEEARVLSRKGDRILLRLKLGHPILAMTNHLEMKVNSKKHVLSFKLVKSHPHELDDVRGYWRLFPQKDGTTLVGYVTAIHAPMGLVNLVSRDLEDIAITSVLGLPIAVKWWIEKTPMNKRDPD